MYFSDDGGAEGAAVVGSELAPGMIRVHGIERTNARTHARTYTQASVARETMNE
jgi:hypothetical protein